ncbi:V4R domain-containing protein [Methanolobus sp. ZRKC3]|uniref:V4R domain-containing protein n=1 Tax=Methanolobus sp. ZRKC3 TaxID=3125786 RepID=UPI003248FA22
MVRDLYMFSRVDNKAEVVWFKIEYENTLHSEAEITSFLADKELDIRFAYLDCSEDPHRGKYVIFTEVDRGRDLEAIVDELKKMNVVLSVDYGISKNRVMQSVEFPLNLLGERAIIVRSQTFVNILEIIHEHTPQAEGLLMLTGIKSGSEMVKYLQDIVDVNKNNCLDLLRELFMAAGWGILECDVDHETLVGSIKVKDSFIAQAYGENEMPVCGYISGFFAGFISAVAGRNVQVHESYCKSMGSEVCEHLVSPAPEDMRIEHVMRGEIS